MSTTVAHHICQVLSDLFPDYSFPGQPGPLKLDSRTVNTGDIFIALKGHTLDGCQFIDAAITQGAALVLAESDQNHVVLQNGVPVVYRSNFREELGTWLFQAGGISSEVFHLIGVTGTNGKTSVSHYIAQLLEYAGQSAAVIGTVGAGPLHNMRTATYTTPDIIQLHQLLADLFHQGYHWQAIEVSSHALDQQRIAGAPFKAAVFTNLSRDHLDYHGTMQAYGQAKARLFQKKDLAIAVVNLDDPFSELLQRQHQAKALLTYSLSDPSADLFCSDIGVLRDGFELHLNGRWGAFQLILPLFGMFNIANVLAAVTCLAGLGVSMSVLAEGCRQLKPVPGRMQNVSLTTGRPAVVVDYAHTPDALENALCAVRGHLSGNLWCIFGCGGDRDAGKRPQMAEVAERLADHVVVTSDNPRSESPLSIIDDIRQGLSLPAALVQSDRYLAIKETLAMAGPDDVILLAGKGHETYQEIKGVRHDFDDVAIARQLLEA
ncbi:UDP-N-acetylmuramoyl-L-alanyl-D-glutamate--2,6-diaminopimelate ligase [Oceanospirillum sediminis]|uniref:UDP-N-acetylmuramoyl-L-alanyl-D-glutamate--2,6-diaminopimelate ligase n=1 Tax=Oceanospirillum sediminis TaxID=2760088 RepID=A0A839IMF5_9GAMM|nr:UDP-N-acetylmuramoyl-L-alanyl-D-glutamate--2,6-diaminopimelate ligase [Oceanospirillum sediminis]